MKKILLLSTCVLTAAAIMLSFQVQHKKNNKRFVDIFRGKGKDIDAGAAGMADYFRKIEVDPATGQMDLKAYYNALNQAANLKTASSRSAGSNLGLQWNFVGPDNIGGRTRAILFDRNNPDTVYAGGVSGGLWISGDGGQSWVQWSGSNQLKNLCIVSICQDDSGYIYFGTGEGFLGIYSGTYGTLGTVFPGYGVWKGTTPHNTNFVHLSSTTPVVALTSGAKVDTLDPTTAYWSETNRLAANPHSPDSIIAATVGGILVSGNGGNSWTVGIKTTPQTSMGTDVKYSVDGKKVFASINSSPNSSSPASLYYSANGGKSFTKMNGVNGFPKADIYGDNFSRIEIAVSPQTPNYAYAALVNMAAGNGYANYGSLAYIVQTTNGGATWNIISTGSGDPGYYNLNGNDPTTGQGPYDLALAVSPTDSNTIFIGGTILCRWTPDDGMVPISAYAEGEYNNDLHADIHALVFDPTPVYNGNRLLIGCDGGIAQTLNPYNTNTTGVLFSSLNRNYDVTQFYSVAADSQGRAIGGTQDNSDEYINFLGNTTLSANQVLGGDGGTTQITSNNDFFASIPGDPNIYRSNTRGNSWSSFYDSIITASAAGIGQQFVLPFNIWEDQDSLHYFDSLRVGAKESLCAVGLGETGTGEVWVTPSALDFEQTTPGWFFLGSVTGDVTVEKFSLDGKYLYVGTDEGYIYRYSGFDSVFKENGWTYPTVGVKTIYNWTAADSGISVVKSSYSEFSNYPQLGRVIMSISVDPNNYNNVVVTAGNFGSTYTSWIATSTNAETGFTFKSAQGAGATSLPLGPVYSSCMPTGAPSGTILAGTWCGVWSSQDFGSTWHYDNGTIGIGNEPIFSIKQSPYYGDSALYLGTFGLGLWTSYTLTSPTGINLIKGQTVKNLNVFPNPLSGTGNIQFTIAKEGNVIINLYDITGKLVKNIVNENMIAGPENIQFNAAGLASGTYIVDVIQGQNQATAKLAVLR